MSRKRQPEPPPEPSAAPSRLPAFVSTDGFAVLAVSILYLGVLGFLLATIVARA
jgi:hypothetical protein